MKNRHFRKIMCVWTSILFFGTSYAFAQEIQTNIAKSDTNSFFQDSSATDTLKKMPLSSNAIKSTINYEAEDSLTFDIKNNKAFLHNQAQVSQNDINLKSYQVELDFDKNELTASGRTDTNGKLIETPVFSQGSYTFESEGLTYNFTSQKGLIKNVITQEDESFLHGNIVKKDSNNNSFILKGKYTTCNLPEPHFEAFFKRAKVIPNDKIVTGALGVKVANVPLPIGLPFGYFPTSSKHKNGILIPSPGQDSRYGFYFKGLGYYFAIKDVVDFAITTNIYTRGSIGAGLASNYAKRYKFSGNLNLSYEFMREGIINTSSEIKSHNFSVQWTHQQSPKAHPTNRFSASVNFMNNSYNQNTVAESIQKSTQASTSSSISFSTSWKSRYFLGINAELNQNLSQKSFTLKLPYINFNISQFYPFRRKKVVGKLRWWENISMQYTVDINNELSKNYDSTTQFFSTQTVKDLRYGIRHSIPIKSTVNIFKHLVWTNTINFVETWQFTGIRQTWGGTTLDDNGHLVGIVNRDTNYGFYPTHNLNYTTNFSINLYGLYSMKKGRISAFRHELTPSVNFMYIPNLNKAMYHSYFNSLQGQEITYSYLANSLYGVPANQTSASINFSISNRLEMKVKSRSEEGTFKKITLLENVTLSSGYDFAADSLRWKYLTLSGRTTLFKSLTLSFNFNFDPYSIDSNGYRCNVTELKANHRLFRLSSTAWNLSLTYNLNNNTFKSKKNKDEQKDKPNSPSAFGDWNIAFSYNLSYNMTDNMLYYRYHYYVDTLQKYTHTFRNIINIRGNFALTPKWSVTFSTGYDFQTKSFSASEIGIERDLHCWKMGFSWIPFGSYRRFEFSLRAKANMLRDVKYEKKKDLNN